MSDKWKVLKVNYGIFHITGPNGPLEDPDELDRILADASNLTAINTELLAALSYLVERITLDDTLCFDGSHGPDAQALEKARAALAKAEGKQP